MWQSRFARILRIIVNSFTFILLLFIAFIMWQSNPLISIVLVLAAVDQFEDIYYYTYRKRLFPKWFMPIDFIFELVVIAIGVGMMLFSLLYYAYFETWFFKILLILSIMVVYSAIEDIVMWSQPEAKTAPPKPSFAPMGVMHFVCSKKEVRGKEARRFVHRK